MSNAGGAGDRALGAVWRVWQGRTGAAKASGARPNPARRNAPEGNPSKTAQARPDRWPDKPARAPCDGELRRALLKRLRAGSVCFLGGYARLTVSFCPIVRLAKHLAVGRVGRTALAPCCYVVGIHFG